MTDDDLTNPDMNNIYFWKVLTLTLALTLFLIASWTAYQEIQEQKQDNEKDCTELAIELSIKKGNYQYYCGKLPIIEEERWTITNQTT